MRMTLAGAAAVIVAIYSWWLISVGRGLERSDNAAATAALNARIAASNAEAENRRRNFEMEVERAVQTTVSGITQSQDCTLTDDVVKKLNRIGRR